ncbi:hypothetical protein ACQP1U_16900 [Actinomycetota bacterium]
MRRTRPRWLLPAGLLLLVPATLALVLWLLVGRVVGPPEVGGDGPVKVGLYWPSDGDAAAGADDGQAPSGEGGAPDASGPAVSAPPGSPISPLVPGFSAEAKPSPAKPTPSPVPAPREDPARPRTPAPAPQRQAPVQQVRPSVSVRQVAPPVVERDDDGDDGDDDDREDDGDDGDDGDDD